MKFIKELLVLMGFCCLSNSYAMENGQDSIKELINMRDQLGRAKTIIELKNSTIKMPIFKSVEDIKMYDVQVSKEALCAVTQAYQSYISITKDVNVRPEIKQAADSLLDDAIMQRIIIDSDLD